MSSDLFASIQKNIHTSEASKAYRRPTWNPQFCGDLDIVIKRDGTWHYMGTPIGRQKIVNLFASVLRREEDKFYLVTPVEKIGINVEDAPFVARLMTIDSVKDEIAFETVEGYRVVASAEHPILFMHTREFGYTAYVQLYEGILARIDRNPYYELMESVQELDGNFVLTSCGATFVVPIE